MSTPPPVPEPTKPKLVWYQQVWLALPFALVAVGGAIGGACGGAAWAINQQVFKKTKHTVLRYVWTGNAGRAERNGVERSRARQR